MSLAKYKNGTLYFSKDALARFEKGDFLGGAYKSANVQSLTTKEHAGDFKIGQEKREKKKMSYEEIMKKRETIEDFMTGKRHKKSRGAMGKIH